MQIKTEHKKHLKVMKKSLEVNGPLQMEVTLEREKTNLVGRILIQKSQTQVCKMRYKMILKNIQPHGWMQRLIKVMFCIQY